ncbi:hypothetical protein E2562_023646 [Oryza meyeriana var. granulata]|uniref:DUF834 domain-containing protein n=1 Tax=Oryza meyeriana var. granulata TaxID=110450 RepID=A0A6G1BPN2_9ORYZ|nr:hypothetical protein E2562_023646 [Oryza meyeriana var. granulata]
MMARLMDAAAATAVRARWRPYAGGIRSAATWWIHSGGGSQAGGDGAGHRGEDAEGEAEPVTVVSDRCSQGEWIRRLGGRPSDGGGLAGGSSSDRRSGSTGQWVGLGLGGDGGMRNRRSCGLSCG